MFIFDDERLTKIFQESLGYDDATIMLMKQEYTATVIKAQLEMTLDYVSENKLTEEEARIDELTEPSEDAADNVRQLERLVEYLYEIYAKYPKIYAEVKKKIDALDRDLAENLFNVLDDDALVKIGKLYNEDRILIEKYRQQKPQP